MDSITLLRPGLAFTLMNRLGALGIAKPRRWPAAPLKAADICFKHAYIGNSAVGPRVVIASCPNGFFLDVISKLVTSRTLLSRQAIRPIYDCLNRNKVLCISPHGSRLMRKE